MLRGELDDLPTTANARPLAHPIEVARAAGAAEVQILAVRLLKKAGFSTREIGALCVCGWDHVTIWKA